MTAGPSLPLPTLLSQVLVAFTIECNREFERRMPHRMPATPPEEHGYGPRLTSFAMWSNFMRFVGDAGVPLRELEGPAWMTNLAGLQRSRYITLAPDPSDARAEPPRRDWLTRATPAGRRARKIWQDLPGTVERRKGARPIGYPLGAVATNVVAYLPHLKRKIDQVVARKSRPRGSYQDDHPHI